MDTHTTPEPILDVRDDAPDGLEALISHDLEHDLGFADVWAPFAVLRGILDERRRLGLSQADVAARMGLARTAVVKLENDPTGVSFGRILAYARAVGVEVTTKRSKERPRPVAVGKGRRVRSTS